MTLDMALDQGMADGHLGSTKVHQGGLLQGQHKGLGLGSSWTGAASPHDKPSLWRIDDEGTVHYTHFTHYTPSLHSLYTLAVAHGRCS
jgi:hypothetical protein